MTTMRQGLHAARTSIVVALGFATAFVLIATLERWHPVRQAFALDASEGIPAPPPRKLTQREQVWASVAWKYFERNYRPETGLVDSVEKYPASTMWDTGSYLMALISAQRLQLITRLTFDARVTQALDGLARLPLYDGDAPNKSYNTVTLAMVDYNNQPAPRGIGWSAIDVGRILVPLQILVWHYPNHTKEVGEVLARWKWTKVVQHGTMIGAAPDANGRTAYVQEGRLGYEEYAAKAFSLAALDVQQAMRVDDFLAFANAYGVRVATDTRAPEQYRAHNHIVSEPYILDGLEFGFDDTSRELAYRVAQAQEARYHATGLLTAVSEDHLDRAPHFVFNTVFTDGRLWNAVTADGADASEFKTLSTKAAMGWYALYETEYTKRLVDRVELLYDHERGWYAGVYERNGETNAAITCNTNAIVLESLCYKQSGPLLRLF